MSNYICPVEWNSGILSDKQISILSDHSSLTPMITPFTPQQVSGNNVVSWGLSSYGYDVRISDKFKIIDPRFAQIGKALELQEFNNHFKNMILDPTDLNESIFTDWDGDEIIIPPQGFVLGKTIEVVNIPRDVLVIALAKSTWARVGLVVGVTPLEPGFEGTVTIELSNTASLPVRVKAGHGICQFLFFKGSLPCELSYADRKGKYMHQRDVTLSKTIS